MAFKIKNKLNKDHIVAFLRANKTDLRRKFGVTKIALFGSYARDEQKTTSDIDLLIDMKVYDFNKRLDLRDYLEAQFQCKVDIGYFSSVRKYIMRLIEKDLIYA